MKMRALGPCASLVALSIVPVATPVLAQSAGIPRAVPVSGDDADTRISAGFDAGSPEVPDVLVPTPAAPSGLESQLDGDGGPDGPGLDMNWYTVDGGGATFLTGGVFQLGSTAGQPDAGSMAGGNLVLGGGFWYGVSATPPCYANCDGSTSAPVLNALDFGCFLNRYQQAQSLPAAEQLTAYANCDGSTSAPVLNAIDFSCYLQRYQAGCP